MARHIGKNGKVKLGSAFAVGLESFDIEEQTNGAESLVACGDAWDTSDFAFLSWSGTITLQADHGADGQTLRAGDLAAFEGYTEGDATGKTYLAGNIRIEGHAVAHSHTAAVKRTYRVTGIGALNQATVSA